MRLLHKLQDKSISAQEFKVLKECLDREDIEELLFDTDPSEPIAPPFPEKYEELFQQILEDPRIVHFHKAQRLRYFRRVAAVAASVLLLCGALYWGYQQITSHPSPSLIAEHTVPVPGGNKAQILLADGGILDLEALALDTLVQLDGYAIYKDADGQVTYRLEESSGQQEVAYNTIITPKGGEYRLTLSDGTHIVVNAMSSLRYPIRFGTDKRTVELLSGEAYFEVNKVSHHDTGLPFVVKTKEQVLTVLGTVFNINSYAADIVTTLVEGSVQLENQQNKIRLVPTDQAIYREDEDRYDVHRVDPYYLTAWKDGKFAYEKGSIHRVMQDIARWYDVEVEYAGSVQDIYFSGTVSRFEDLDKLLNTISLTGSIKFVREGRRIVVMK